MLRPLSLLLLALSLALRLTEAAPIITAGPGLTAATWPHVNAGTWLVEHYSPYCGHCKSFAPTWRDLVDTLGPTSAASNFHFAQVDCAANGDLCQAHGVKYYPSIFLYVAGEKFDEFDGKRTLSALSQYVADNMPAASSSSSEEEEGEGETGTGSKTVLRLADDDLDEPTALEILLGPNSAERPPVTVAPAVEKLIKVVKQEVVVEEKEEVEEEETTPALVASSRPTPPGAPPAFVAQPRGDEKRGADVGSQVVEKADGTVRVLFGDDLLAVKAKGAGPAFVKFYAPWCGHCKSLAPKWKELASGLKNQVIVYEMDCDDSKNKKICRSEGVQAFPTLVFYNEGAKVEYNGKRDVSTMKLFATKAASSTAVKSIANEYELKRAAAEDDVIFLFLHSPDAPRDDIDVAQDASKHLIGGPPFYTSSSPDFFDLFSLPPDPVILVFKAHSLTPSASLPLPPSTLTSRVRKELVTEWFRTAKLSLVTELNGATYADVMATTGSPPLVGVAVLSHKKLGQVGMAKAQEDVASLAKGWEDRVRKSGKEGERAVVWTWVDGDKWSGWAWSMYGLKAGHEPVLVISDPKALTFWKNGVNGAPLSVKDDSIYTLIKDGIYTGTVPPLSSRTFLERVGDNIMDTGASVRDGMVNHPLVTLFFLALVAFGVWSFVRWLNAPEGAERVPGGSYAKLE